MCIWDEWLGHGALGMGEEGVEPQLCLAGRTSVEQKPPEVLQKSGMGKGFPQGWDVGREPGWLLVSQTILPSPTVQLQKGLAVSFLHRLGLSHPQGPLCSQAPLTLL